MSRIHERIGTTEPAMLAGEPGVPDREVNNLQLQRFSGFSELPHHWKQVFLGLSKGSPHQQNYFVGGNFFIYI